MSRDPKRLLGGHATDTLTEDERRELMRAALDDQELFDALLEEDGVRELLGTPGARRDVLLALERPTAWQRVRSWLARPATFGDLAMVAATLLVAFVGYQAFLVEAPDTTGPPAATQPAPAPVGAATLARLLELPPRGDGLARLEAASGDRPARVEAGEPLALRATVGAPARVLLIAPSGDGSVVQAYPTPGAPPVRVEAPAGGGPAVRHVAVVAPDVGTHRVRLVVAPADVDLGAASPADVDRLAPRLTLVDLTYEVIAP